MPASEQSGRERRRSRKWGLWLGVLAALYATYLVAGFYLAPGLIKSQATQWVRTNLNKDLTVGEVRFNPFTLGLDVNDIAIPGANGPMVALGHLRVGFSLLSLFQEAYRFTELRLKL